MKSLILCSLLTISTLFAREISVNPVTADALKRVIPQALPGDVIVLGEGEWRDVDFKFRAEGTKDQPITLKAATPGKTIFTGNSRVQISGHYLVVEGLWFRDPSQATGEVIEFRTAYRDLAFHCTVRDCAVTSSKPVDLGGKTSRFVSLYGSDNVVERCHIEGKTTGGTTLVVWLTPGSEGRHIIKANYFGPRPPLKANGGETIRLGDSETHDQNARCEVTGNLFHHCNGEGEIISVKSCENHLASNTFLECEGALTLRHAHRCLVENNLFAGNHKKYTGGVRIVGEDHIVRNNWIENCEGDDYRCAITFMNGIPNTENSGYQQVKRALLEGNTVLDSKVTMLIGLQHDGNCTASPMDCIIKNNTFLSPKRRLIVLRSSAPGWKWENNAMIGKDIGIDGLPGVVSTVPPMKRPSDLKPSDVGTSWKAQ